MKRHKIVVLGDPHCPNQDEWVLAKVERLIQQEKPTAVVVIGDLLDADAASRHPSEAPWSLEDEYNVAEDYMRRVEAAAPRGCRFYMTEGNHDANIRAQLRIPPKVRSLCDYRKHISGFSSGKWKIVDYVYSREYALRCGQVAFAHGFEAGVAADDNHAITFCVPNGLYVGGHTHKPTAVRQVIKGGLPLGIWTCNVGVGGDFSKFHYMERKRRALWGQGAAVVEAMSYAGEPPASTREWSARVEVFRTFQEAAVKGGLSIS